MKINSKKLKQITCILLDKEENEVTKLYNIDDEKYIIQFINFDRIESFKVVPFINTVNTIDDNSHIKFTLCLKKCDFNTII